MAETALLTLYQATNALTLRDSLSQADNAELEAMIDAVTALIEHEVGAVIPREETFDLRQGGPSVALSEANVLSLTTAAYAQGGATIDVTGLQVDSAGILRTVTGAALPAQPWRLTAQVGMDPTPNAIRRAALEALKEAWLIKTGPQTDAHTRPFLLSYRTMAWLEPFRTGPGFA